MSGHFVDRMVRTELAVDGGRVSDSRGEDGPSDLHADPTPPTRKRKRKRKRRAAPSGRASFRSSEMRGSSGRADFAVINAMFESLPHASKAYFQALDASAATARDAGVKNPFGPTPFELTAERARAVTRERRKVMTAAIMDALANDKPVCSRALVPADMRPPKPLNKCGEFGDTLDDLKAYIAAERSLHSQFDGEARTAVRDLLRQYNTDPQLNDDARRVVASGFGLSEDDQSFTIVPPLHPKSINVRWRPHGVRDQAQAACSIDNRTMPGMTLAKCIDSSWGDLHKVYDVGGLPKLGVVPPIATRSWAKNHPLHSPNGVIVDMMRQQWDAIVKKRFPPKSNLRSDLAACYIIVSFVGTRTELPPSMDADSADGPHTLGSDIDREEFVLMLVNRHCLSPWEAHFMQLMSERDPRAHHFISFDVFQRQQDAWQMFDTLAFGGHGDGARMTWSTTFLKLMERPNPVAELQPDVHGAERLFDSDDTCGVFPFWGGMPSDSEIDTFKRRTDPKGQRDHGPADRLPRGRATRDQ
jgi:hypothetical protein